MNLHYDENILQEYINNKIDGLIPSNIPENIEELVPEKIWNTMNKSMQKDIKELYEVYYYEQWTATSLMACRILENTLAIHIECDLGIKDCKPNIGNYIKILERENYPSDLIEKLHTYREKRNNFMHGVQRASPKEAKNFVSFSMSLSIKIHNIQP